MNRNGTQLSNWQKNIQGKQTENKKEVVLKVH